MNRNSDLPQGTVIKIGDWFEGSVCAFQNAFFDNAYRQEIEDWANQNDYEVEILNPASVKPSWDEFPESCDCGWCGDEVFSIPKDCAQDEENKWIKKNPLSGEAPILELDNYGDNFCLVCGEKHTFLLAKDCEVAKWIVRNRVGEDRSFNKLDVVTLRELLEEKPEWGRFYAEVPDRLVGFLDGTYRYLVAFDSGRWVVHGYRYYDKMVEEISRWVSSVIGREPLLVWDVERNEEIEFDIKLERSIEFEYDVIGDGTSE